ncbi:hypothetical protein ACFL13_03225 [Patescibacteria group bacterium]
MFTKSPIAQKSLPLIALIIGSLLPFLGLFIHYRGSVTIAFIITLLGLAALGYAAFGSTNILGILAYVFMFLIVVGGSYVTGFPFLTKVFVSIEAERMYIFKVAFAAVVFLGSSHYLIRQEGRKKLLVATFVLLFVPLMGFLALAAPTFFENIGLPKILLVVLGLGTLGMLFVEGKQVKILGILGFLITLLFFGLTFFLFGYRIYLLEGKSYDAIEEKSNKVIGEALDAYDENDMESFGTFFTPDTIPFMEATFDGLRDDFGNYSSRDEPEIYYTMGLYFVAFPAIFEDGTDDTWLVVSVKESGGDMFIHTFEIFEEKPNF